MSEEAISGEEFICSPDYFIGYRVISVTPGEAPIVWTITFESGGVIHNYSDQIPQPVAIVGAALTRVIMDSTRKTTRLQFGLEEVVLNPMEYAMVDDNFTKGQTVFPQQSQVTLRDRIRKNAERDRPDDPSSRRNVPGPKGK